MSECAFWIIIPNFKDPLNLCWPCSDWTPTSILNPWFKMLSKCWMILDKLCFYLVFCWIILVRINLPWVHYLSDLIFCMPSWHSMIGREENHTRFSYKACLKHTMKFGQIMVKSWEVLGHWGSNVVIDESDFDAKGALKMQHKCSYSQVCPCSPLKHYFQAHSSVWMFPIPNFKFSYRAKSIFSISSSS